MTAIEENKWNDRQEKDSLWNNDTKQLSVVLSDHSPSSSDTHTLTNTWKLHKLYLEQNFLQQDGFWKFVDMRTSKIKINIKK